MDLLQLNLAAETAAAAAAAVSTDDDGYHETTLRHLLPGSKVGRNNGLPPPSPPPRTTTKKVFHNEITAPPPKPFADMNQYNTLQVSKKQKSNNKTDLQDQNQLQRSRTLPRKSQQSILPPPPQYKGVHFAPGVPEAEEDEDDFGIPTEGLPKGPAKMEVKVKGETIPIKVRKMSAPVILKPQISESSSMTFVQVKKE